MNSEKNAPNLIRDLYKIVRKLEEIFPGRPFTPDGHLVGSIGEAIASHCYGVTLVQPSTEGFDGTIGNIKVEVKATQSSKGSRIGFRVGKVKPNKVLVFLIMKTGKFEIIYNGDYSPVEDNLGKVQKKNGQRFISVTKLLRLHNKVDEVCRIDRNRNKW